MKGQASAQGMGRHSQEEVIEMGMKDLRAMSAYLGTFEGLKQIMNFAIANFSSKGIKPYFMGDTPTEMDCAMFGMLAMIVWCMPGSPFEQHMKGMCVSTTVFN